VSHTNDPLTLAFLARPITAALQRMADSQYSMPAVVGVWPVRKERQRDRGVVREEVYGGEGRRGGSTTGRSGVYSYESYEVEAANVDGCDGAVADENGESEGACESSPLMAWLKRERPTEPAVEQSTAQAASQPASREQRNKTRLLLPGDEHASTHTSSSRWFELNSLARLNSSTLVTVCVVHHERGPLLLQVLSWGCSRRTASALPPHCRTCFHARSGSRRLCRWAAVLPVALCFS
jgi:hypothetical protein